MKKIFTVAVISLFSFVLNAKTVNEYILDGTLAGLNYKNAVKYAELKVKSEEDPSLLKKRQSAKLSKYEEKISLLNQKNATKAEFFPEKMEKRSKKIESKTVLKNKKRDARNAYENFIYEDKEDENNPINPKTGFPEILEKPFVIFDEGVTFDMVTRLQKQDKHQRNDFVWQDYLVGAYFDMTSVNMKPVNSMIRISAYYPFYHTFNGMEQVAKQTILYAFDVFAGPVIHADMWKYVRLNLAGGIHYMYQLSDEYHLNYLGAGILTGIELPVARRWTIVNNGTFTLDYANLGSNQRMCPYDYSWSYQISLGVRYSKKYLHKYAYIHHIDKEERAKRINAKKEAKEKENQDD